MPRDFQEAQASPEDGGHVAPLLGAVEHHLELPMGRSGEVSECDCGPPIQVAVDITLCTGPGPVSA